MRSGALADLVPVILAGGSGTRLWPVSRAAFPKHLVELTGESSLLQATASRLLALASPGRFLTVAAAGQAILVRRQLALVDPALATHLLLEPAPRNTAAAVALAALYARDAWGGEALLWICPSDHLIADPAPLRAAVVAGAAAARAGHLVTFGIEPTRPETGFGYIAQGDPLDLPGVRGVRRFVEKPNLSVAEAMLAAGDHLWNSGMFLMRASTILEELEAHAPDILAATRDAMSAAGTVPHTIDPERFGRVPSLPIDKAVMERSQRVAVVPCDPGWSDVGSWQAIWEIMPKDPAGNALRGDVVVAGGRGNLIRAEHRLVAVAGVDDLAVIETADAVMVAPKADADAVKALVARLVEAGRPEALVHAREVRPWGAFTVLAAGPGYMVREVEIDPGAALDRQRHAGRDEHWTVVGGELALESADGVARHAVGAAVTAARGQTHRLSNPAGETLRLIEVRIGSDLDDVPLAQLAG
ncbi:MAG: mannose-1-phosphate guanylyltransferase/mannose-6-phosphate isomerase [Geminicoccaceae bacterium]|nr:mannose-1-phosphate guanylyltransferase/mannose-6-phosphate isomerase [Geminicoccaceae bacterium]MCB9969188.1 mannose-1-phosphate guanylyltransferase/mannose-6-phosphate isomerase [Geminicoccaceae bacterium]HRY24800.1 mannose-1-phosphate guanylyltransferase/mannose-6-phosphate isomerase [Geminicoccaceae bacterium]